MCGAPGTDVIHSGPVVIWGCKYAWSRRRLGELFSYIDLETRVRAVHLSIHAIADKALGALSQDFPKFYSSLGRPSVAPEMLFRAMLLQSFYSVLSERQLMERLQACVEFSWAVFNDVEQAFGRCWAIPGTAGRIVGDLFILNSNSSGSVAERA